MEKKAEEQDVVNGFMSGGDDYILKPFSLKELDARITAHIKMGMLCMEFERVRRQLVVLAASYSIQIHHNMYFALWYFSMDG